MILQAYFLQIINICLAYLKKVQFVSLKLQIQRRRFDKQIKSINRDHKHQRRSSFTSHTKNMWSFVKIDCTKRFKDLSPFGINKILEVKDIEILRSQFKLQNSKSEQIRLKFKKLKEYAFVGKDNVVYLLSLHTKQMKKLLSANSHAIGIYYDKINNYYLILTKELNMLFYNKATLTLKRRGDLNDASRMLCLDNLINSIFTDSQVFQSEDMTEVSMKDFETFNKICEK